MTGGVIPSRIDVMHTYPALWPRWVTFFVAAFVVLLAGAVALTIWAPAGGAIVVVGPLESGRTTVVLFAAAFGCLGLAPLVAVTGAASRSEKVWPVFATVVVWVLLVPFLGVGCLLGLVQWWSQPSVVRVGDDYLVALDRSWSPTDEYRLSLYRREGHRYVVTGLDLPVSRAHTAGPDAIRTERRGARTWIVVPDLSGVDQRVLLP